MMSLLFKKRGEVGESDLFMEAFRDPSCESSALPSSLATKCNSKISSSTAHFPWKMMKKERESIFSGREQAHTHLLQ